MLIQRQNWRILVFIYLDRKLENHVFIYPVRKLETPEVFIQLVRTMKDLEFIKPVEKLEIYKAKHPIRKTDNHTQLSQSVKEWIF
jgi:hypothetical protein